MQDGKPKRDQPWAVRGVSVEAREAAVIAARVAGVSLGVWLDRVVRNAAADAINGMSRQKVTDPTNEDGVRRLARHMLDMKLGIENISNSLNEMVAIEEVRQQRATVRTSRKRGK